MIFVQAIDESRNFLTELLHIQRSLLVITGGTCWHHVCFRVAFWMETRIFPPIAADRLEVVGMPSFLGQITTAIPALSARFVPYVLSFGIHSPSPPSSASRAALHMASAGVCAFAYAI